MRHLLTGTREVVPRYRARRFAHAKPRGGRRRQWLSVFAAMLLVLSALSGLIVALPASAGTTVASTFSMTGSDLTNPSSASVGSPGTTHPGDTLKWVMNYQNTTGSTAQVGITDPITGNQTYVPGSLQAPPSVTPEWSTNGGTSYVTTEPPSGVNAVGITGTPNVSNSTGENAVIGAPTSISAGAGSGDGFNLAAYNGNIYNVFHATYPTHGARNAEMDCHVLATGARCGGVFTGGTATGAWVPATAGAALIPGTTGTTTASFKTVEPLWTTSSNFAAIDQANGRLYYAATYAPLGTPTGAYGTACVDLKTLTSCGFTQLGTDPQGGAITEPVVSGGAVSGSNFWVFDYAGNVDCLNMTTNAPCATSSVVAFPGYTPSTSAAQGSETSSSPVYTYDGRYLFAKLTTNTGANPQSQYLSCVDTTTDALCNAAGWASHNSFAGTPTVISQAYPTGAASLQNAVMAPVVNSSGTTTGVCTEAATTYAGGAPMTCLTLAGGALADPYPISSSSPAPPAGNIADQGLGNTYLDGTKVFVPYYSSTYATGGAVTTTYACFDFSNVVGGIAQPCAGYTALATTGTYGNATTDVRPYTLTSVGVPDCLGEDGDNGILQILQRGHRGGRMQQRHGDPPHHTGQLLLRRGIGPRHQLEPDPPERHHLGPVLECTDQHHRRQREPRPRLDQRVGTQHPAGDQYLVHPVLGDDDVVERDRDPAERGHRDHPGTQLQRDVPRDAVQVCFETTVPNVCQPAVAISNVSNAVTTGANSVTDAPGGNSSGTVTFNEAAPGSPFCSLAIKKTVSESTAFPGDTVTYTVAVTNTGTAGSIPPIPRRSPTR